MQSLPAELVTAIAEYIDPRQLAYTAKHINIAVRRSDSYRFFTKYKLTEENLVKYGTLNIIKYVSSENLIKFTTDAIDWAAMYGHLQVVQWLHENRTEGCTTDAMNWAARNGHLHVVQWLHENRTEGCTKAAMYRAIDNGHTHIVQYLTEHYPQFAT